MSNDDFDEDMKDDSVISSGGKVKSSWNAGEHYYKLLGRCKEAFFQYSQEQNIIGMFWLVKHELSLVEPFIIKKVELIKEINKNLNSAESLLFNINVRNDIKNANKGLSLKYINDAWADINKIEAVNGLLQPLNKSPDQKIRQYGG